MDNRSGWDEVVAAIGARIRAARNAKGFSLRKFADDMKMSHGALGHWETGTNEIRLAELWRLCELLEVSADQLLFGIKRWPFDGIDFDKVSGLEAQDRHRLEGAMLAVAAERGIDIQAARRTTSIEVKATVATGPKAAIAADGRTRYFKPPPLPEASNELTTGTADPAQPTKPRRPLPKTGAKDKL